MRLIPDWVYWIAIGLLLAGVGAQQVRVANAQAALATEQKVRADETIERQKLVITHSKKILDIQFTHANTQQETVHVYETKLTLAKAATAVERARADRMSRNLSDYTSTHTRPGETDAAACERAQDRLPRVGALLTEGVGLEVESRELIEQRDAEVELLLTQIKTDRIACSPPSK